jgi:CRP-like cAMP-binding protein/Fe-S-cluster-containing dehydrogenase component
LQFGKRRSQIIMSEILQNIASVIVDEHVVEQPDLAKLLSAPPVTLWIDDQPITIKPTSLATNPRTKEPFARPTTIYDAANELYKEGKFKEHPIPILCHREHLLPVAVCRFCVVDVSYRDPKDPNKPVTFGGRLVPACHRQVEANMVVQTYNKSARVRKSVEILTQLLLADHDVPRQVHLEYGDNELRTIASRLNLPTETSIFPRTAVRPNPYDESSLVIAVDHNACILCDRCIRGCDDIRNNQVLGRMGKGYRARIAFDLNDPMGQSSCVSCGECMVSCPTGALTNRKFALRQIPEGSKHVDPEELFDHPLFEGVSVQFLGWNQGAIVRRTFRPGEIICREGDFGHTAFILERGEVEVYLNSLNTAKQDQAAKVNGKVQGAGGVSRRLLLGDAPVVLEIREGQTPTAVLTPQDVLFGEMSCMNNYPRSATIRARTDVTVMEISRNVLYILQRNKKSRALLERVYAERAISGHLRIVPLFSDLQKDEAQFQRFVARFKERMKLVRFENGEVIFREKTEGDSFFLLKIGFVKVSVGQPGGGDYVLDYISPGGYFGEIALLSSLPEMQRKGLSDKRTATCTAIDHVDCVKIMADDFKEIVQQFPVLRDQLVKVAMDRLGDHTAEEKRAQPIPLGDFVQQGLMNARSLLVLDLTKCTRCDECTKACHDAHLDDITRLIRDGLRYENWLVASSCRACLDPYCMVGCPVDSIHRHPKTGEMRIEDHCIGCGSCANNCPYGNINMHGIKVEQQDATAPGGKKAVVQQKASMCDLCIGPNAKSTYSEPSCVYACPHDAAHRYSGDEFRAILEKR